MEEILFYIVCCQTCNEISVVDMLSDEDVDCPACKGGDVRVKSVKPSTFNDFAISTNVTLCQFFEEKTRGWRSIANILLINELKGKGVQ